ncbi:Polyamine-modulated factor 1-binding protein 1 [Orchesella cincta]|uniref:Polyamine-modulated factor 1-binding protein 1 n=1 Tax=Orchesella cincta TaxID=48709 RepID=A0A1D2NEJ7_ORCCI|nr:Polyamine-modulated factor 1-binding protein 1 [Orchesella cincta]
MMREKVEFYAQQLKTKDEEIKVLKEKVGSGDSKFYNFSHEPKLLFFFSLTARFPKQQDGENIRVTLHQVQAQLDAALGAQDSQRRVLEALNAQLAEKIQDLASIHSEINTALQS